MKVDARRTRPSANGSSSARPRRSSIRRVRPRAPTAPRPAASISALWSTPTTVAAASARTSSIATAAVPVATSSTRRASGRDPRDEEAPPARVLAEGEQARVAVVRRAERREQLARVPVRAEAATRRVYSGRVALARTSARIAAAAAALRGAGGGRSPACSSPSRSARPRLPLRLRRRPRGAPGSRSTTTAEPLTSAARARGGLARRALRGGGGDRGRRRPRRSSARGSPSSARREAPAGIEEAEEAAARARARRSSRSPASRAAPTSTRSAPRRARLEQALGEDGASPFAAAMQAALRLRRGARRRRRAALQGAARLSCAERSRRGFGSPRAPGRASLAVASGRMEGGGFGFPFGGDPEEIMRGLREFAEKQAEIGAGGPARAVRDAHAQHRGRADRGRAAADAARRAASTSRRSRSATRCACSSPRRWRSSAPRARGSCASSGRLPVDVAAQEAPETPEHRVRPEGAVRARRGRSSGRARARNVVGQLRLVAERPERPPVRPRRVAGASDVPHRDDVVDPPARGAGAGRARRASRSGTTRLIRCSTCAEQRVDPRRSRACCDRVVVADAEPELAARRDERDRQIAVDVRVHAGQRELERRHAAAAPRTRTAAPTPGERSQGRGANASSAAKKRPAKLEVERGDEARVCRSPACQLGVDRSR